MKQLCVNIRWRQRRLRKLFCRYINGTRGVISIFLAILMVPFVSMAGALINAARINSAIAIFDEALCNASNSTLGTYDKFLKQRFGLLAIAQNSPGSNYTAEDFISETFQFYMKENLGALSNTYTSAEASAIGVYPLSNTDVLLTEVMEFSKYTVPTKLVIDGLSLDSILKDLTKSLNLVGSFFNLGSSGLNMATSSDTCQKDMNTLIDKLKNFRTKMDEYTAGYSAFNSAVEQYNAKVDEMKTAVAKCDQEVKQAEADLAAADEESYETAQATLEAAKTRIKETTNQYHSELSVLRQAVESSKSDYVESIIAFSTAAGETGSAAKTAKESIGKLVQASGNLINDTVDVVYTTKEESIKKNTETMNELKKATDEAGNSQASYLWEQQIKENDRAKQELSDQKTVMKEAISQGSTSASKIEEFEGRALEQEFNILKSEIDTLKEQVVEYTVVAADEKLAETSSCYVNFAEPITFQEVIDLLDNLALEVAQSSFLQVLKSLVGFIKAMFTLTVWADPELCASINNGVYSSTGGLPSQKNRNIYSLDSSFEDTDRQQSDYYKSIMGGYSSSGLNAGSVSGFEATVQALREDINTISNAWDEIKWYNVLFKLGEVATTVASIGGHLITLVGQMLQVIVSSVYEKLLLAGYIGYNIPNRTTYNGSALTGASYNLPSLWSGDGSNMAFYGAEAEYIIMGNTSEIVNQTLLFHIIYVMRLFINVPSIILNSEVESIASAAGAATFGIGTFLVYALYIFAEPLVDTLILVNKGDVPIIKTIIYLTPSGVGDLIKAFYHLSLTEDQKNQSYKEVVGAMSGMGSGSEFAQSYGDAVSAFGTGEASWVSGFKIDYTQTLILIMLFINTESMLERLGDVIQMEAAYNEAGEGGSYTFDLDKSFTYLRSSGSFTSSEFIRLSNTGILNSTNRVVYRGY